MPTCSIQRVDGVDYDLMDSTARTNIRYMENNYDNNILLDTTWDYGIYFNGSWVENSAYRTSDYIKIVHNVPYIKVETGGLFISTYNSSKELIEYYSVASNATHFIITDDTAEYMRIGIQNGVKRRIVLPANIKNVLEDVTWETGVLYNGETPESNVNYNATGLIPAVADQLYWAYNAGGFFVNYYNVAKEYLGTIPVYSNQRTFTIGDKRTQYIRISLQTGKRYVYKDEATNLLDGVTWEDGVSYSGGEPQSSVNYRTTSLIEIKRNKTYYLQNTGGIIITVYNETTAYITTKYVETGTNYFSITEGGAKYIRISIQYGDMRKVLDLDSYVVFGKKAFNRNGTAAKTENGTNVIHIGADQEYKTLRSGIAAAMQIKDCTVYVHPGIYDLKAEFGDSISSTMGSTGIAIGNGIHVIFYDTAFVRALFTNDNSEYDATTWRRIYDYFEPFKPAGGDYTLENLNIECSNTRYCVHDEMGGNGTYIHRYINCRMKYTNDHIEDASYIQCIGGGLGLHGSIVINGGYYESVNNASDRQEPISYHNGSNANCESSIYINNVYLANDGYFRFGWYGDSTRMTPIQISGCSSGWPTLVRAETANNPDGNNFELREFCDEVRLQGYHWEYSEDKHSAELVPD